MSRSNRKTPIVGMTTEPSDAAWKAKSARKVRAAARVALAKGADVPDRKAIENAASAPKDGKQWIGNNDEYLMRK